MAPYNPQLGNTVTPILGLILSLYEDQEHREYDNNWGILDSKVNGGLAFSGVAPIFGQVLTATLVGGVLTAVWTTPSSGGGGVSSFNGRVGAVTPLTSDYSGVFDPLGAAAAAIVTSEAFATAAVGTETSRALAAEALLQPLSQKGAANGYASLNASGVIPSSQLPPIALTQTYVVGSQAAMLALPSVVGTVAVRTDLSETFILQSSPASTLGNWVMLEFPAAAVTSVNGYTGTVSLAFTDLSSHPTTLAGYGITNALPNTTVLPITIAAIPHQFLTSYSSGTGLFTQAALAIGDIPSLTSLYDVAGSAAVAQSNAEAFTVAQGYISSVSPALTGTPTAPTAAANTDNTQIATTAYADNSAATGGGKLQTARSVATAFTQGGVVGPILVTFATPFADNNYTFSATVTGQETAPGTPTITQFPSVGISYTTFQATAGVGLKFWVANNDSIAHTGVINVIAWHD
jgi:hypothetical protein